tara:strand:- start:167 stop:532 length:366 start_codon:yes stop_codon:yes gene_type:complete
MKKIILILIALTLTGCHFRERSVVYEPAYTKTVVVETPTPAPAPSHGHSHGTTTVVVEQPDPYVHAIQCPASHPPFYEDPYQCFYYSTHTECDWYVGWGCYEVWTWDEYTCEWYYSFDYCI